MATITAQMVKDLREATGAGPLDCKKALQETGGDLQAAIDYLREKGIASANKKLGKGRSMNEGTVAIYQSDDKKLGVIVEVNCETDFVSSNEIFQKFAQDVADHIAHKAPAVIKPEDGEGEALMSQTFYNGDKTLDEMLKETVAETGESIQISNMARFEAANGGVVAIYQHFNKLIAAMVELNTDAEDTAYDIAMHLSNLKPQYLTRDDVPAEVIDAERKVQLNRAIEEGKPEHIAEKIVEGRMGKFFEEIVLVEQAFLKDDSKTIAQLLKESNSEVVNMARFAIGEGDDNDNGDDA